MTTPHPTPATETPNPLTGELDAMSVDEILRVMNDEDAGVAGAVAAAIPAIARAVDLAVAALSSGGRLVYQGAGTSGRLGVLDAAECPPTFGTDPAQVVGLLAGGNEAMFRAIEGAEDSRELGADDLTGIGLTERDVVVGIAASGRTPYVIGGLDEARRVGAATVAISCSPNAEISACADERATAQARDAEVEQNLPEFLVERQEERVPDADEQRRADEDDPGARAARRDGEQHGADDERHEVDPDDVRPVGGVEPETDRKSVV